MLNWLHRLLFPNCSRELLEKDLAFTREQLEFWRERASGYEIKLEAEIKRNRSREDRLTNSIRTKAGTYGLPPREPDAEELPIQPNLLLSPPDQPDANDPEIDRVVEELQETYKRRGVIVQEADIRAAVASNLDYYLSDATEMEN